MLRVVFAGTPEFARVALEQIYSAGHRVVMVMTQPDRPAGRGMNLQASPVKQFALEKQIKVIQPTSLKLDGKYSAEAANALKELGECDFDVMVVAAYGLILPKEVFEIAEKPNRAGCLNIHASLLPRWRGAAPIHRAIEAGDSATGIAIMQMDLGLDTGPVIAMKEIPISDKETTASLHDSLASLGGEMIVEVLRDLSHAPIPAEPQPPEGVTYAHKIEKNEAAVDWQQPAEAIGRRVRAFNPFPAASTQLDGEAIKLWCATVEPTTHGQPPGTVLSADAQGVRIACGEGVLCVTELQRAGGKRLAAADFLRGFALSAGQRMGG